MLIAFNFMKDIKVDQEKCIGCGTCSALCPAVFELNNSFKAFVKDGANIDLPCTEDAKDACPVEAIEIKS